MELRPVWRLRLVVGGIWGGAAPGQMSASAARHGQAARAIMSAEEVGWEDWTVFAPPRSLHESMRETWQSSTTGACRSLSESAAIAFCRLS